MKRAWVALFATISATACCLVPKISTTHPTGYKRLVPIEPRCEKPHATDFAACSYSAEMLEADDPRKATAIFMNAWEKSAFGDYYQSVQNDRKRLDSVGLVGDSISLQKGINAFKSICIPVLTRIYQQSQDPYAREMESQIDLIIVDSESSLASFRAANVVALETAGTSAPAATPAPATTPGTAPAVAGQPGQVIHLRDGSTIRGEVLATDNGTLTVRTSLGTLKIDQSQVERIEFAPAPAATATPGPSPTPSAAQAATPAPTETPALAAAPTPTPAPGETTVPTPTVSTVAATPTPAPISNPNTVVVQSGPTTPILKRLSVFADVGWHQYSGWAQASHYSAPAFQLGAAANVLERASLRVDAAATLGYYGGSHCQADSATTCARFSFSSLFLDLGPRATWHAPHHVLVFGEAGPAIHSSTFHWSVPAGDPAYASQTGGKGSSSTLHFGGYAAIGAGYDLGSVRLFSEVKGISANATFPGKTGSGGFFSYDVPIGMGGQLVFLGAEVGL